MTNWTIKKINNKNSKYDFRLVAKNNNYSNVNFFKYSIFRILVSLSSYLTNGIIFKNSFFKIEYQKKTPAIFNFSILKTNKSTKYLTASDDLSRIIFVENSDKKYYSMLSLPDTKVFPSLYEFEEVNNVNKYINQNKKSYSHIKFTKNNRYIITGYLNLSEDIGLILDLLKFNYKKSNLTRCKISDSKIINELKKLFKLSKKKIKSYCLLVVEFTNNYFFEIEYIIPITFDEYLTYLYDLMLPFKYDINDINNIKDKRIKYYDNNDIERNAFAIDPNGSKDRDDAISAFYIKNNKIVNHNDNPTHIKLIVHISDTLSYINPSDNNYYYHYCKYKCNTDYLDKHNLPMMDRLLSENFLSLDGDNKSAITINMLYRIIDNKKFLIKPYPDNVYIHQSKNLNIYGTTYTKFSESFKFNKEDNFNNNNFIKRNIINCNKKLIRDYNEFIHEGSSLFPNDKKKSLANNLKQLYIFFVNSLNHTGKDSLIKVTSNLIREKKDGITNIYLDFLPSDMWCHSLVEYTALESNIYFSYFMYLKNDLGDQLYISIDEIKKVNNILGSKNLNLLFDNIFKNKKVKASKSGIYRNLYCPSLNNDYYLNEKIIKIIKKIYYKFKVYSVVLEKFIEKYDYKYSDKFEMSRFLKLILALRQVLLLINSNTNLDVSLKLISDEIKMKAKYSFFPFAHYDICSLLYTHATSPMRRFLDINVHNFIFNNSTTYLYRNIDLDGINLSFNVGKYINQLVNNHKFAELIELNQNLITNVKIIDEKTIGFIDLNNFFKFTKNFNLKSGVNKVELKLDKYNLPIIEINKKGKKFDVFSLMLNREEKKLRPKITPFLQKILSVKKVDKIC